MVRKGPNRRDRRPQENGGPKNKRARRSTSDHEEDSNSEDEEREEAMLNKKTNGEVEAAPAIKQEEDPSEQTDQNKSRDAENRIGPPNGVKLENDDGENLERCLVNGEVKKEPTDLDQSGTKPYAESPKPYVELPAQSSAQTEQVSVTMTTTEPNRDVEEKPNVQSESSQPAVDVPPPQPVKRM